MDITVVLATGDRAVVHVTKLRATIGRREDCDIRLDSKAVSRLHAEIVKLKNGAWEIRDLDSLNGLQIDGKTVRSAELADGTELTIGDARLIVGNSPPDDETIVLPPAHGAELWLDNDDHVLRRGAAAVGQPLSQLEYALLRTLADANGRVVGRHEIEEAVWGADAYDDNALHQLVRRTREKLGDDPGAPRILLTRPGVGYRLELRGEPAG